MIVNYEEIEEKTSKEFVEFLKLQLGKSRKWKYFEIIETENTIQIDAISCYVAHPEVSGELYWFSYFKENDTIFHQCTSAHFIERMIQRDGGYKINA